jgi:mevalonate kinase
MNGSVRTFGKCILLGEHSAVRAHPALVFPLSSRALDLSWRQSSGEGLAVDAGDFAPAFRAALGEALRLANAKLPAGAWHFTLTSTVPPQAGLGSSAALSVAIAKFFTELKLLGGDLYPFALELENLFHGKSSGMDVAAVLSAAPILFRAGSVEKLTLAWRPRLFLSDTGLRSSTKSCVEKVIAMNRPDLDERNANAVLLGRQALGLENGRALLGVAMEEALACFRDWDLVPASVEAQLGELKKAGALAVKPTGSGNGGYLLSLWEEEAKVPAGLIPVWADS